MLYGFWIATQTTPPLACSDVQFRLTAARKEASKRAKSKLHGTIASGGRGSICLRNDGATKKRLDIVGRHHA